METITPSLTSKGHNSKQSKMRQLFEGKNTTMVLISLALAKEITRCYQTCISESILLPLVLFYCQTNFSLHFTHAISPIGCTSVRILSNSEIHVSKSIRYFNLKSTLQTDFTFSDIQETKKEYKTNVEILLCLKLTKSIQHVMSLLVK